MPYKTKRAGAAVGRLAGQPVRLRFALKDADLFSFRFREATAQSPPPDAGSGK
jgi:hypothetical protein